MKTDYIEFNFSINSKRFIKKLRIISMFILITFSIQLFILPSLYPLTIEEQAGKKSGFPVVNDEFNRKTPARRAFPNVKEEKDPRLACLLSLIVPGGGHIYLKKDIKGIALFSLTIVGYSAAGYYLYKGYKDDAGSSEKKSKMLISGLFFLVGVVFHIVGIVEAYNDTIEINKQKYYYGGFSKYPHIAKLIEE